jgi:hypothetical protein
MAGVEGGGDFFELLVLHQNLHGMREGLADSVFRRSI